MESDALAGHSRRRDELLSRITRVLADDPRVVAAWLAGSIGRDQADAWSDLDLHVAIADDHVAAFLAERAVLFRRCGRPVLIAPDQPAALMADARITTVLCAGAIIVDCIISPAGEATRADATLLLFDRVGISTAPGPAASRDRQVVTRRLATFWAMAPVAVNTVAVVTPAVRRIRSMC